MALRPLLLALLIAGMTAPAAQARDAEENVTWAWAQVLRASPVYRMVQVPTTEQRCDPPSPAAAGDGHPGREHCRTVPTVYTERRLVGYDVEYVYKGEKYMSRLAADPGSRLRIRIAVVPDDPAMEQR
jgi:uncharacterized protein YcfJ